MPAETMPSRVCSVPGPCAAIAAIAISGFETDRFTFFGFVPQKQGKRRKALEEALSLEHACIFYESPHRILKTMAVVAELAPEREVFIGRELTKVYEESIFGTAADVLSDLSARHSIKGEIVLIIRRNAS